MFKGIPNDFNTLELSINVQETNINVKELSSYLELIYKIDRHLIDLSIPKYSHNHRIQIEITEIRFGSWDIVINRLLKTIDADYSPFFIYA